MKNTKIKLVVLSALSVLAAQATATGLVAIPDTGFASSAYTSCNTTGNFGSSITINPTAGANNTCAVFPISEAWAPVAGYIPLAATTRPIPTTTGGTGSIGSVLDAVWRNYAGTMCIFGTRISMTNADHDSVKDGVQWFEVNDIARGGFSAFASVNAGYYSFSSVSSPVYRIGRTFTSVQHRAFKYDNFVNKQIVGANYLALPTKNSVTAAITGENTPINAITAASTTLATQDAAVNSNWVDFTMDAVYQDDDGSTAQISTMTYVQAPCNGTPVSTWVQSGAISLRQTAQELTTFKSIEIDGYAPPGATVP